ncbi:MAG: DUF1178 family protein [Thermodesulfobacteriota bacterium]
MIAFDLVCANGHRFECWFKSNQSFEEQKAFGLIMCPICEDNHIEKAISPIGIRRHKVGSLRSEEKSKENTSGKNVSLELMQMISEYVEKNFEDVGLNFAREALKIHFGEAPQRNIRGMALPEEEKVLQDEGVKFLKIPIIKRLDN